MFGQLPRVEHTAHFPRNSHEHRDLHHFQICPVLSQYLTKHSLRRPFWPPSQLAPVCAWPAGTPQSPLAMAAGLGPCIALSQAGLRHLHLSPSPAFGTASTACGPWNARAKGQHEGKLQFYGNVRKSSSKVASGVVKKRKGKRVLLTKQSPLRHILFAKQCTQKPDQLKLHSYILNSLKLFISILKIYASTVSSAINF